MFLTNIVALSESDLMSIADGCSDKGFYTLFNLQSVKFDLLGGQIEH